MKAMVGASLISLLHHAASADVISETNPAKIDWGFTATGGVVTYGEATVFPSVIDVSGAAGAIIDVNVTINQLSHAYIDDVEISLRSPSGSVVVVMQDAGGNRPGGGILTFDDEADAPFPDGPTPPAATGTYKPSVYDVAGSTAPPATGIGLSTFDGENPNGQWELYVFDDADGDVGWILDGWTLDIVTIPAPASAALLGLGGLAAARRRR